MTRENQPEPRKDPIPVITPEQFQALELKKSSQWAQTLLNYLLNQPMFKPMSLAELAYTNDIEPDFLDGNIGAFNHRLKKAGIPYKLKYYDGGSPTDYPRYVDYFHSRRYIFVPR